MMRLSVACMCCFASSYAMHTSIPTLAQLTADAHDVQKDLRDMQRSLRRIEKKNNKDKQIHLRVVRTSIERKKLTKK